MAKREDTVVKSAMQWISISENSNFPEQFYLGQNYPNPFNAVTLVKFDLPQNSKVSLIIYDVTGRKLKKLINQNLEAGSHEVRWGGKDDYGRNVASGLYFYKITAQRLSLTKKALLIK